MTNTTQAIYIETIKKLSVKSSTRLVPFGSLFLCRNNVWQSRYARTRKDLEIWRAKKLHLFSGNGYAW